MKGKEKRPDWNLLKVVPHRKFQVAGARYSRKGGASVLAVEIENNTRENQRPAIRIPGAPAQRLELKPQEIRTVLFPAPAERQEKLLPAEFMAGLRPCAGVFQTEGEKQPALIADLQILRFGVREGQNGGILRRSDK